MEKERKTAWNYTTLNNIFYICSLKLTIMEEPKIIITKKPLKEDFIEFNRIISNTEYPFYRYSWSYAYCQAKHILCSLNSFLQLVYKKAERPQSS